MIMEEVEVELGDSGKFSVFRRNLEEADGSIDCHLFDEDYTVS